jgi:ribulose-phosphate 3-epimerase
MNETGHVNQDPPRRRSCKIAPSILSADFGRLAEQVHAAQAGGADWIHVDVMDGHFVPNISIGPGVVRAVRRATTLPLDVHLMIERPTRYLTPFAEAGADLITVHLEACVHLHRTIQQIHELGCRAGVSLNPATPVGRLEEIAPDVDLILLLAVDPGFGGQSYIPATTGRITRVRALLDQRGRAGAELEIDGGVKVHNAAAIAAAGATVLVAGSAVFNDDESVAANIAAFREQLT